MGSDGPHDAISSLIDLFERRLEQEPWRLEAACRDVPVDVFFDVPPTDHARLEEVRSICAGCPVQDACLAFALERREREGVWGGTSGNQRRRLRQERRQR